MRTEYIIIYRYRLSVGNHHICSTVVPLWLHEWNAYQHFYIKYCYEWNFSIVSFLLFVKKQVHILMKSSYRLTKSKFCLFTTDHSLTMTMRSDLSNRNSNSQLLLVCSLSLLYTVVLKIIQNSLTLGLNHPLSTGLFWNCVSALLLPIIVFSLGFHCMYHGYEWKFLILKLERGKTIVNISNSNILWTV